MSEATEGLQSTPEIKKPEVRISENPSEIYQPAIRTILGLKAKLDGRPALTDIPSNWQEELTTPDIEQSVTSYYLKDGFRDAPLKIPEPEVEDKMRGVIASTNQMIEKRTGRPTNYWEIVGVKETILLNELAYRYYLAREVLSPLVALWMNQSLTEYSQVPGSKKMAFLYRDGYLPETFARAMLDMQAPGIQASQDDLVAVDVNRINAYEDPGNVLNRRYNPNLKPYLQDKIGGDDGKSIFVVDTGKIGTMLPPISDNYPNSTVHARYYDLEPSTKLAVQSASSFVPASSPVDFSLIEHTLIPKGENGEYRERSYDFQQDGEHWEPIFRGKSDPAEAVFLGAFEEGYKDYLEDVANGRRVLPGNKTDVDALLAMAQTLLGGDEQFGYSTIKNIDMQVPSHLKPDTDDTQEMMRLKNAMRAQKSGAKNLINYENK